MNKELLDVYISKKRMWKHLYFKYGVNYNLVDDMYSELFIKLNTYSKSYVPGSNTSAYIHTIVKNHAIDYSKEVKRSHRVSESSHGRIHSNHLGLLTNISIIRELDYGEYNVYNTIPADSLDKHGLDDVELEIITLIKNKLSKKEMEILRCRYYDDMKYDEIAEDKNIPLGTVKAVIFRGRKKVEEITASFRQ